MTAALAAVVEAPNVLRLREFPLPEIGADDGLLQVEIAGVDASDGKYLRGEVTHRRNYPIVPGDEAVGRILTVGEGAARRWGVQPGDRVVVDAHFGCGDCLPCLAGQSQFCARAQGYGARMSTTYPPSLWGAMATVLYLPRRAVVRLLPDEVAPEAAVMACSMLSNGLHWVRDAGGARPGRSAIVFGVGQQGLGSLAVARLCGAAPIVAVGLSRDRERLAAARRLGADRVVDAEHEDLLEIVRELTGGRLADLVVDTTGSPAALESALAVVARQGTLVLAGLSSGQTARLDPDRLVWGEVRLQGVYSHGLRHFHDAVDLVLGGRLPLADLVTHRLPLAEAERAIRLASGEYPDEWPIKVVIEPGGA